METSEVLNRAADLIEERGWWSNSRGSTRPRSALCAGNAMSEADCGRAHILGYYALAEYIVGHPCESLRVVWKWNDHPDRTVAEVIEVLRATAVIEAAREAEHAGVSA